MKSYTINSLPAKRQLLVLLKYLAMSGLIICGITLETHTAIPSVHILGTLISVVGWVLVLSHLVSRETYKYAYEQLKEKMESKDEDHR